MRYTTIIAAVLFAALLRQTAVGHGDPILIGLGGNQLSLSHRANSFPPLQFGQDTIDGLHEDASFPPPLGDVALWDLPGLEINGLTSASSLSIEPLTRPVLGAATNDERLVWFWNPTTDQVEPSSADMYLLGTGARFLTLSASSSTNPGPFLLANSLNSQQGFHNHGLMNYALANDPVAASGVYGFFARFLSSRHDPSEEFLLVFNKGTAFANVAPAALAIWAAANALPGDFNRDGNVDAADYTVWRNDHLGPEKYLEWKSHFGASSGSQSGAGPSTAVPEPASAMLMLTLSTFVIIPCRRISTTRPRPGIGSAFCLGDGQALDRVASKVQSIMPFRFSTALLLCLLLFAWCAGGRAARAAGVVMNIGVTDGKLVVSGGTPATGGYVDQLFLDTTSAGFAQSVNVSGFGPSFQWTVPGVHITDMKANSGLYIEALAVPDSTANPARDRVYWHWSGITQSLQDAPIDNHFLIYKTFAGQGIYLTSTDTTSSSALKMASPLMEDMNVDNYGTYVKFALHKESPPPIGVYAVFARFKSDQYAPSEPFLLAFNNGSISPTLLTTGAMAINAAAGGGGGPTNGDFNGDGKVDAADYSVWRNGLGTAYIPSHYNLWKRDFGQSFGGAGAGIPVPEPMLATSLAAIALVLFPTSQRRTRRSMAK